MGGKGLTIAGNQIVGEHVELPRRNNSGIKLSNSSCRSIARICKLGFTLLFTFGIYPLEDFSRNENFTTNFDRFTKDLSIVPNSQGYSANRSSVLRNILANASITATHSTRQNLIFIK